MSSLKEYVFLAIGSIKLRSSPEWLEKLDNVAMDIDHARIFLVVAQETSFKRAAERAFISPSRVSQVVKELEEEVGTRLLDRSTRTVRLTPAGEHFVELFESLLVRFELAESEFLQYVRTSKEVLRLGFITSAGYELLPKLMRMTSELSAKIEIVPSSFKYSVDVEKALARGELDLGLIRRTDTEIRFDCFDLILDPMVLCFPQGEPYESVPSLGGLLESETVLTYPPSIQSEVGNQIRSVVRTAGAKGVKTLTVPDTVSMLSLVAAGIGIAFLPQSSAGLGVPKVSQAVVQGLPSSVISLAWNRESSKPALHVFVDSVRERWIP